MRSYVERTEDLFVLPDIPDRVLQRVEKRLELPEWEQLLAIIDTTALGDGRAFLAFTTCGMHVEEWLSSEPKFQPWDRILRHRADPTVRGSSRIRIGDHIYWPTGSDADWSEVASMIDELGGWAPVDLSRTKYDPVGGDRNTETTTTVVPAESLDELVESIYVFTYRWFDLQVAPTIERSLAEPLRLRHNIPNNVTLLAVPEIDGEETFALTDYGLVGLDADKGRTIKKPWSDVRARQHSLVIEDDRLELDRRVFDLSSVKIDEGELLELIRFVALRVPRS